MNWGLGHASRCVPLIRELLLHNIEVVIAADGRALQLLRNEFPQLKWFQLGGYDINYSGSGGAVFQILVQLPKFFLSFFSERKWLNEFIAKEKIDIVISDNRYGLYNRKIFSVFIAHQICIQLPIGFKWMEGFLYRINKNFISRFNECWMPDVADEKNLSGNLAHQFPIPPNTFFIGPLSRFKFLEKVKHYDLLMVISGPETQRTEFEELLTEQAKKLPLKILMVRGIPESNHREQVTENFLKVDFMNAEELNHAFLSSKIIVARSGYSTVMDLVATKSRAILIPTPGQTEQEYLAEYLQSQNIFYSQKQNSLNLIKAIEKAKGFNNINVEVINNIERRITQLLEGNTV
ncbi:MAG: hypothetical protein LH473_05750 [Chitinophagales bacterium]|nr:hypothetical protein [Chitinophagales bacterium]